MQPLIVIWNAVNFCSHIMGYTKEKTWRYTIIKKILYIIVILIICSMSLVILPKKVYAASPSATLTADGVLIDTYASVQEAVDAVTVTAGTDFVIEVAAGTVTDPLNILQQPNKNLVVRPQTGATVTFTNTITVDGFGNLNNPETLLIQGFNFDFSSGTPANCIDFNLIPPRMGFAYPHNVTINGCTFKGVLDAVVAVQSIPGGMRNIAIINCTATDMHSLAQLKAVSGYAFIQNCVLSNSSGGVNFYGTGDLTVDSCNFDVAEYAVRSGQGAGMISSLGSVTINNSVLNSHSPTVGTVVLRGDSTENINIIHSNLTNTDAGGSVLQNLNAASQSLYKISIIESNITGQITGITLSTINTIDDPKVPNGPVSIIINPSTASIALFIIAMLLAMILIVLIIAIAFNQMT